MRSTREQHDRESDRRTDERTSHHDEPASGVVAGRSTLPRAAPEERHEVVMPLNALPSTTVAR